MRIQYKILGSVMAVTMLGFSACRDAEYADRDTAAVVTDTTAVGGLGVGLGVGLGSGRGFGPGTGLGLRVGCGTVPPHFHRSTAHGPDGRVRTSLRCPGGA